MKLLQIVEITEKTKKPIFIKTRDGDIKLVTSIIITKTDDYCYICAPLSTELYLTEIEEGLGEFYYKAINPSTSKSQFDVFYPSEILAVGELKSILQN